MSDEEEERITFACFTTSYIVSAEIDMHRKSNTNTSPFMVRVLTTISKMKGLEDSALYNFRRGIHMG